jgi:hypothetical protein
VNRFIGAVLCSWLFIASAASAQDGGGSIKDRSAHTRPMSISAMLYLSPWYNGLATGVVGRFEIPIVPDGFIPAINDQFSLEPSLGLGYRSWDRGWNYNGRNDDLTFFDITPALYATWSFHINPKFRPYAAIGLGYTIGIWMNDDDYDDDVDVDASDFYVDTTVGLFWNFSEYVWLRAELGWGGPKVGLAFAL